MNSNELLSYLHDVRDLEQICYTCNTGINNLQYKANRLGIYKKIKLPEKKEFVFFIVGISNWGMLMLYHFL